MIQEADPQWEAFHTTHQQQREWVPERTAALDRKPILDEPREPHPLLVLKMDEILLQIILVSDGAVMPLRERTTGSHAGTRTPSSDLAAIVHELDTRFERCTTNRKRLEVIKAAQALSNRLRFAPDRSLWPGSDEWKEKIAQDSRSCRVLADVYGVGKSTIARIKREAPKTPAATIQQQGKRYSVAGREKANKERAETKAKELATAVEEITVLA